MAYQNVGTPRFYISWGDWWKALGSNIPIFQTIRPTSAETLSLTVGGDWWEFKGSGDVPSSSTVSGLNWVGCLNHNLDADYWFLIQQYSSDGTNQMAQSDLHPITGTNVGIGTTDYNGFSIGILSTPFSDMGRDGVVIYTGVGTVEQMTPNNLTSDKSFNIGCWVYGRYYDMPHSPDLKLTMTRELDGVKRIRTKGGVDLVNHKYTKPAMWGCAGAWELYSGTPTNQVLSRIGRRTWSLSFNYLQDSDVFPLLSSLNPYESVSATGVPYTTARAAEEDTSSEWWTGETLLDADTFYSQVIHKTNGGQLPFIFQPDSNNSNPDGFAICKFDMKEFEFSQVANGVYNVKLKIREVW